MDIVQDNQVLELLESWLNSDESIRESASEESKIERKMNLATFPITIKGYSKAFAKVTRRYNEDKGTTTLTLSTLAYNHDNDKVSTQRKNLSVVTNGDSSWHIDSAANNGVIIARWQVKRAMTSTELNVIESVIRKVNNEQFPLWGKNAAREYADTLRGLNKVERPTFEA